MVNVSLLVLRVFIGLLVAAHGAQKVFGWFGGSGIRGTQAMVRNLDVHPSIFWAWVAALDELAGGLLLAFGFLMPLGPLMIFANMLTAVFAVHAKNGFFNSRGGIEFPLTLLVTAAVLGFAGAGIYSIDSLIGFSEPEPAVMIVGLFIVVLGYFVSQLTSRAHVTAPNRGEGGASQGTRP